MWPLTAAMDAAVKALTPGAPCSDAYAAAVKALQVLALLHMLGRPRTLEDTSLDACPSGQRKCCRRSSCLTAFVRP